MNMTDPCYDGVNMYESRNFVWNLVLERHEYIVDVVNPSILIERSVKITIEGVTFGTRR